MPPTGSTASSHEAIPPLSSGTWWPWIRRLRDVNGTANPRWFWTPITYRFGHGGWIYLSLRWFWRFRNGA